MRRFVLGWIAGLALAAPLVALQDGPSPATTGTAQGAQDAQDEREPIQLDLRVTSVVGQGTYVVVDRGRRDGLEAGDRIVLQPRQASARGGVVVRVDERSAVIELIGPGPTPPPGTRGVASIPASRRPDPAPAPRPEQEPAPRPEVEPSPEIPEEAAEATTEHPGWENQDEEWEDGMPLLSRIGVLRPEDRPERLSGRVYFFADGTATTEPGRMDYLLRAGTSLVQTNPFGKGGAAYLDFEIDRFEKDVPDFDAESEGNLRLDRASYEWGGSRFRPHRLEGGRFLQSGMPEFGILDGVEWSQRLDNADRWGASVGFMPELDATLNAVDDFQIAAWYRWNSDATERFSIAGGAQKTWHDGAPDRDLFVLDTHYLPTPATKSLFGGWDTHATLWIDLYDSGDVAKGAGFELTQAYINTNRRWESGNGIDLTARRIRFPEILRNEFLPPTLDEIANDRYDRASLAGWRWMNPRTQFRLETGVWDDEDDKGADAEMGMQVLDFWSDDSTTDVTAYGVRGEFALSLGVRLSHGWNVENGRWQVAYEAADHRIEGFSSAVDDLPGHRLSANRFFLLSDGWTVNLEGDVYTWEQDAAWSFALQLTKSF